MSAPRLVFAGTPDFAARHLEALLEAGTELVAVYTQPDRPAGRGKKLTPSAVKVVATAAGTPVLQPTSLRTAEAGAEFAALKPDLMIVVAYGLILPQAILDTPRFGCINVHASLLPRWRGAAPIQRAIEAGDRETGVTIMQMEAGLDTGPMLAKANIGIHPAMTGGELHDALVTIGPPLLLRVLDAIPDSLSAAEAQEDALATYAAKIEKEEARLDWTRPAAELERKVRAFNPFPVCWTTLQGERVRLWQARPAQGSGRPGEILTAENDGLLVACGEEALLLTVLQLPGGKPLAVSELLRSRREVLAPGVMLGT
jgi:methionyl-tRNA formyltransferase